MIILFPLAQPSLFGEGFFFVLDKSVLSLINCREFNKWMP